MALLPNLIDEIVSKETLVYYNLISHKSYITKPEKEWTFLKAGEEKINLKGKNSKWGFALNHTSKYILDVLKNQM